MTMIRFTPHRGAATALLTLLFCAASGLAQAAGTIGTRHFEVISTDGNHLVVRDESGIQEYTVPPDFRFTVDGQEVGAADLKPGMRGTATLTDATSTRPVHVTMVKMGTVISQTGRSVTVRTDDGKINRFTQSEADARGLQVYMDGKPVRISNLNPGDRLDATIVTSGTPEILTAQALDESLAAAGDAAKNETAAEPAPAPAPAAAAPAKATTTTAAAPAEKASSGWGSTWLLVALFLVVALVVFFGLRNPKSRPLPEPAPRR
jgi:hypothetical protein